MNRRVGLASLDGAIIVGVVLLVALMWSFVVGSAPGRPLPPPVAAGTQGAPGEAPAE